LPTNETIENALKSVPDFDGDADIVTGQRIDRINMVNGVVTLSLSLPTDDPDVRGRIENAARRAVKELDGVREVIIVTRSGDPAAGAAGKVAPGPAPATPLVPGANPFDGQAPIEGVQNIIAVSSAKGGVGKSTVCVNLALAMVQQGARVGLLDADVYGPSLHVLLGTDEKPRAGNKKEIAPVEVAGLKVMSLGLLTDPGEPVIWRGPIVMGVVKKFLLEVDWGELDYLMIDMPPGTGDAQLTLVQTVPLTGAVIVTTPSELALVDAEKGLQMYRRVNAPVLGIIENMSYFVCPHCNERTEIFAYGGGRDVSDRLDTMFLGEIPIDTAVRASGDEGEPIVKRDPAAPVSRVFHEIGGKIRQLCPARGAAR